MMKPEFECIDDDDGDAEQIHTGRIVPLYRLTEGLSQETASQRHPRRPPGLRPVRRGPSPPRSSGPTPSGDRAESILSVHFPPEGSSLEELNRGVSPWHFRAPRLRRALHSPGGTRGVERGHRSRKRHRLRTCRTADGEAPVRTLPLQADEGPGARLQRHPS
ncbi:MAG: hypothetical protein MZU91_04960 [Desulfosudis oleivorans]|nr:hypothetical protein [Desulfosudis oleivorans]